MKYHCKKLQVIQENNKQKQGGIKSSLNAYVPFQSVKYCPHGQTGWNKGK